MRSASATCRGRQAAASTTPLKNFTSSYIGTLIVEIQWGETFYRVSKSGVYSYASERGLPPFRGLVAGVLVRCRRHHGHQFGPQRTLPFSLFGRANLTNDDINRIMGIYSHITRKRAVVATIIIIIFMTGLTTYSRLQYQSYTTVVKQLIPLSYGNDQTD